MLRRMLQLPYVTQRCFSAFPASLSKKFPPRLIIPESEITEVFLKGTGPGGQKINKTSSAVQLKHIPTGIVVKCQETRSRQQNREIARRELSERLEEKLLGAESRTAIKARDANKKRASKLKKSRRKYKILDEEKTLAIEGTKKKSDEIETTLDKIHGRQTEEIKSG